MAKLLVDVNVGEPATCFYSVHIPKHEYKRMAEIDFLIVLDGMFLVVEVKGGRLARRGGVWEFTDRYGDTNTKREGPFEQARTGAFAFKAILDERLHGSRLDFGSVVVTPDQSFADDIEWDPSEHIGPAGMTVNAMESGLRDAIRFWRSKCRHRSHTPMRDVLKVMRPDFDRVLSMSLMGSALEQEYLELASEQYEALRGTEINSRVFVTGGAGSGKTLLAIETARRAAEDGADVLITCRSPHVVEVMRASLDDRRVRCLPYGKTYGAEPAQVLVVDEAQDLTNVADFIHLDELVEGGIENGRWRMFCDPNNQLNIDGTYDDEVAKEYRQNAAQYHLPYNCRNTAPVVQQTQLITGADLGVAKIGEGPAVGFKQSSSDAEAAVQIDEQLKHLRGDEVQLCDVAIVSLRDSALESAAVLTRAFRRGQIEVAGGPAVGADAATLTTAREFKGLEAAHILVVDVDDLSTQAMMARLYVAMTRPRISLWLCVSSLAWAQMSTENV
ncbi:MAG: AAA family ATPase [Fimbriimonadaceae bacterium]|nr:AAA family ATPase [Fimbriimonadaceae bacterium]